MVLAINLHFIERGSIPLLLRLYNYFKKIITTSTSTEEIESRNKYIRILHQSTVLRCKLFLYRGI